MDSSSSSSQQNQYPYPASQQPYNPSRFQSYYSNYQYQQVPNQQQQMYHQQQQQQQYHHQQPQQQYSSYYHPNYSNPYPPQHPQIQQQWNHQEPSIHPPGVSIQPSSASHGQPHFQLPNQNNGYHLPQRTDGVGLGMNHVAALAQLNQLAGSLGAAERPTSGLHGQSWYPQAQGFGPMIGGPGTYAGPGLGSGAFPGNGAGPSGLRSHVSRHCQAELMNNEARALVPAVKHSVVEEAGQSNDKGDGGQSKGGDRRRGDGQRKGGDRRGDDQRKGGDRRRGSGDRRRGDGQRKGGDRRRGDGQRKGGDRRRGDGQSKGGDRRRGDGQSKGGDRRRVDGQSKGGGDRRTVDGQSKGGDRRRGGGRGEASNSAGVGRCVLCNIDCGCLGILKVHLNGKRHKRNLEKLEASENRTICDLENVQKLSGDLIPGTAIKPDNLLVEEETKQNPPQNIPLTDMKSDNLLVEEETKQNPPQNIPLTAMKPDNLLVEEETKQNPPQNIPLTDMKPDNLLVEEETKQNSPQNIPLTDMKPDNLLVEEETKQNSPQNIPLTDMKPDNLLVEEETKQDPPQNVPLTDIKPDNLLVEEETMQKPPQNIPLDTVAFENKLETEQKINNAQEADPPKEANQNLLEKKPMMNQSGNQKSGVKRKTLVGGRKKKNVSKAKRLAFEPSNSEVVIPLMCDLCNVQCGTREHLRQHLLGRQHMSTLNRFEGHHPIYGQAGLQAIYPPNPVTNSLYHSQCPQQVLNSGQVSDPIAGASLLPQNENAAPSAAGVSSLN